MDCCEHAFAIAEQFLDVDRLLDPEGELPFIIQGSLSLRNDDGDGNDNARKQKHHWLKGGKYSIRAARAARILAQMLG